ncbi:hypothetical protein L3X38_006451 [Prunus dulcis]|uniref:Uncharacterized protein n=1 Tax=Prunus dulcis TaxID=3755 RepID=A0AAD4ZSJ5_PRUDU|nr:hypothetical protein L3X38_006451 [Prunus dulcis]
MSDLCPLNDHVSYPGDQPWHVPFPSPLLTPKHDPTSSGSAEYGWRGNGSSLPRACSEDEGQRHGSLNGPLKICICQVLCNWVRVSPGSVHVVLGDAM